MQINFIIIILTLNANKYRYYYYYFYYCYYYYSTLSLFTVTLHNDIHVSSIRVYTPVYVSPRIRIVIRNQKDLMESCIARVSLAVSRSSAVLRS